ncbi:sensor histidine kinase [Bdellovibrio sp. HCB117]|nr:ATP-binding protein [Bdellovibrio bacteriovorus]
MRETETIKKNVTNRLTEMLSKESSVTNNSDALLDAVPPFLDDLLSYINSDSRFTFRHLETDGMSAPYGRAKAALTSFPLPQLLKEFSLLRKAVNEELQKQNELSYEARNKVDEAIDAVISLAVTEFVTTKGQRTEDALTKAETSNRSLEQFAGVAAHDLKSPLATISGYLSLLEEELGQALPGNEYIPIIEGAAERMRKLIDRLLSYARLSGKNIPFEKVDLNDVLKISIQNLHSAIQETQTQIESDELPSVYGDFELLVQVFQNIFSNSIKFRGTKPSRIKVTVQSRPEQSSWVFCIKDQGIGFDPKEKDTIFGLYTTLNSGKQLSGSGIGLATCRKVVELHGGQIWADSKPNHGTSIFFSLPVINAEN